MKRNTLSKDFGSLFTVTIIPTLKDNFSYLIAEHKNKVLFSVDVNSDYAPLLKYAEEHYPFRSNNTNTNNNNNNNLYTFKGILSTHKHWDHAGGNEALKKEITSINNNKDFLIYGSKEDNIPSANHFLQHREEIELTSDLSLYCINVSCHTKGHLAYALYSKEYKSNNNNNNLNNNNNNNNEVALFTGDTLFIGGLGAFFEGTSSQMVKAMKHIYHINELILFPSVYSTKEEDKEDPYKNINNNNNKDLIEKLDQKTLIFPGHEYTMGFMKFSQNILSGLIENNNNNNNKEIIQKELEVVKNNTDKYKKEIEKGNPSPPSTLSEEKIQNLFLRCADENFVSRFNNTNNNNKEPIKNDIQLMEYLYNACD